MSRFNKLDLFDRNKEIVIAENRVLPLYNGMRLQNVKPANTKFSFDSTSNSHLKWLNGGTRQCIVTHSMNCYPIITILNSDYEQLYPTIRLLVDGNSDDEALRDSVSELAADPLANPPVEAFSLSGNAFLLDFGMNVTIQENSPWTCIIGYGSEWGNAEVIATELSNNLLESQQYAAEASAAATLAIGAKEASQSIQSQMNTLYNITLNPPLIVIPSATTSYSLTDESSAQNGYAWHYTHAPTHATTYILPNVTDSSVSHELLVDVDFANSQDVTFTTSDGIEIAWQNEALISQYDHYRFICVHSFGTWMVFPMEMKVDSIMMADVEIDGTAGTALSGNDLQLQNLSVGGKSLTFTVTGTLPSGVSVSNDGLISGTPSASGTYEVGMRASCQYANPVDFTVTFNIQ